MGRSNRRMSFFGELYLRTTRPFLGAEVSAREAEYLKRAFAGVPARGPVLDLGCGHGRHSSRLVGRVPGGRAVIGLELDALSLSEREGAFPAIRADLRLLPIRSGALGGAFAWYSTLFTFDDAVQEQVISEIARCLGPRGRLVVHTLPRGRLETAPTATFETELPGGGMLRESSRFDPETGRDNALRQLLTADGRLLSAEYSIRYYRAPELARMFEAFGFTVRWIHGGLEGEPCENGSSELIMGVDRNA
jgi:SAM-dependent methyltransferase